MDIGTRDNDQTRDVNVTETQTIDAPTILHDEHELRSKFVGSDQDLPFEVIHNNNTNNNNRIIETSKPQIPVFKRDGISEADIAASLVLLKWKHHLSISCINDIIHLLEKLHVSNTPSSWYKVKFMFNKSQAISKKFSICPVCDESIAYKSNCPRCPTNHLIKLQSFNIFSITKQLQNILINNPNVDLLYQNRSTSMEDVRDGAAYRSIRNRNSNSILTLTMNIDGVQFSKGSQSSIWPILLVINELPPRTRFNIENVILAGVWPGPSKPPRNHIRLLYRPLIDELLELENGHMFSLSDGQTVMTSVYLIAACCDKPAQSIIQRIAEPIAAFGCGRCETEGSTIFLSTD